ncbi:outer membrane beta-barrel protein [Flavisolibacter tropicus]|uniref:Outer membrane protein beta-barrel domain-containing protein n=1 Tax=Flavisolibacter tropicus TaxID=1492898 RepID=A0A172TQJ4_9BACT|nr:outer membrane beta-barrel protein [Flavisolibacter tropicus]ANE49341.1 hypothetical protein SY85_01310 [Flavisolibacter tropicus]
MKKVLFSLALVVAGSAVFAQTEKGKWTVGAGSNALFATSKVADADNDTRITSFNIAPDAGYFFADNFAGGLRLDLSTSKMKGADEGSTDFTAAPFLRYYFLKPTSKKINIFADASYGFGTRKSALADNANGINEFTIQAGPAFWLNEKIAIDATLAYNSQGGEGIDNRFNTIGLNFGFRLSLGNAKK